MLCIHIYTCTNFFVSVENHIYCTCYLAIADFGSPNLLNIFPLHAKKDRPQGISFQHGNKAAKNVKKKKIYPHTWLPPFWRASTSCEVNFAIDTDFTRWVNSRLYDMENKQIILRNQLFEQKLHFFYFIYLICPLIHQNTPMQLCM